MNFKLSKRQLSQITENAKIRIENQRKQLEVIKRKRWVEDTVTQMLNEIEDKCYKAANEGESCITINIDLIDPEVIFNIVETLNDVGFVITNSVGKLNIVWD